MTGERSDRRASDRFDTLLYVLVSRLANRDQTPIAGYIRDVSTHGVGLVLWEPVSRDETVVILTADPDQRPKLTLHGRVAWCHTITDTKIVAGIQLSKRLTDYQLSMLQSAGAASSI